ncbi:MAG: hypothetical protein SFV81_23580 [Pirellulaceae bacterium]|nr:hypothetical protein [Pirellulaceae bacterium]
MAADTNFVTFMAREGKQVGGERRQVPVTIPTLEFVRRWCENIGHFAGRLLAAYSSPLYP